MYKIVMWPAGWLTDWPLTRSQTISRRMTKFLSEVQYIIYIYIISLFWSVGALRKENLKRGSKVLRKWSMYRTPLILILKFSNFIKMVHVWDTVDTNLEILHFYSSTKISKQFWNFTEKLPLEAKNFTKVTLHWMVEKIL